jgi:hypothetical protein
MLKEIYQERRKNALNAGIPVHRGPVGEPGGDSIAGTFREKRIIYLGSFVGPRGH